MLTGRKKQQRCIPLIIRIKDERSRQPFAGTLKPLLSGFFRLTVKIQTFRILDTEQIFMGEGFSQMNLENSTAIVTGGASGLGEATVRKLVETGAKAVVFDLQQEKGAKLEQELKGRVRFFKTDVTDEKSVQDALEQIESVNILVNCAGIGAAKKHTAKAAYMILPLFGK